MNILFITIVRITDIEVREIYQDLMRKFRDEGHQVYIVSPRERRFGEPTALTKKHGVQVLGVKTLNMQKSSIIEKGLGMLLIENQFRSAIKKHLSDVRFDLILYSTPPITFPKLISELKKKNVGAVSYLLLKDIFPQNAVDLGMMKKSGLRGLIYFYFRKKEQYLYRISDWIGCMSKANVDFVINHNPDVNPRKVEIAPNSMEMVEILVEKNFEVLVKYGLPTDKPIFIYGGNLGKPQGIPFLIECLDANKNRQDCHFVVIGDGVDYKLIEDWYQVTQPQNMSLLKCLPKEDYDRLVNSCDVGMIFLDYRFTIPNFPSRLIPYMMMKKPIFAATDVNSDLGTIATENGFGEWCPSNSVEAFTEMVTRLLQANLKEMGQNAYNYFKANYTTDNTYNAIMAHFK